MKSSRVLRLVAGEGEKETSGMSNKELSKSELSKSETMAEKGRGKINPKRVVLVAAFAAFLATFNETFLNIALTPIMKDTGVGVSTVQWLVAGYMLGAAVMVPVSAFAYRSIPTKRLFMATVALMIIGSIVGGLAPNFTIVLIGRVIQALGTGMMVPVAMNVVLEVAPREKLGAYMGVMGAMVTLGPSLSMIMSGVLLTFFHWKILFWVFAGLLVICMALAALFLHNLAHLTHPKLDAASVALICIAMIGILYGISILFTGSILIAVISIAVGACCLALFVRRQKKLKEPLIDLRPLQVKPFTLGVSINVVVLILIFCMNIIMPIFMQSNMGATSMKASLVMFPAIILCCALSPVAGRLYDRFGPKWLLPIGFVLMCVFVALLALARQSGSLTLFMLLYIPVIGGSALIVGPVQSHGLSFLPPRLNPHGVTIFSTGFQIAGCIGSSVFTGIYAAVIGSRMAAGSAEAAASETSFSVTVMVAAACALVGIILSVYLGKFKREAVAEAKEISELQSIMKTDVYAINENSTLLEALQYITDKKISGAPVVDTNGNPVGFISDGDILRYLAKTHPLFENAYSFAAVVSEENGFDRRLEEMIQKRVGDIAKRKVISVDLHHGLDDVCRVLQEHHLKKAPVMDGGKMVGIINNSNITKYALQKAMSSAIE